MPTTDTADSPEPRDCATCGGDAGPRAVNAAYWVPTPGANQHGGHYERRDFCTVECANAAPKYPAPKRARAPRAARVAYGDYGQLCAMFGQPGKRAR